MTILKPKCGDEILISNCLRLIVLEIHDCLVKFGVCDATLSQADGVLSEQLAELCRNRSCYFWFPRNACCMLVMTCAKGKGILLTGASCVNVLDITAQSVTLAFSGLPRFDTSVSNARRNDGRTEAMHSYTNHRHLHQLGSRQHPMKLPELLRAKFWQRSSMSR